jgi:hypothetical protein
MQVLTRKVAKVLLVMAMVGLLFMLATACSSNGDDATTSPSPSPTPPAETSPPPGDTPATPTAPPLVEHTGPPRVIRITSWYGHTLFGALWDDTPDPEESGDYELDRLRYDNMRAVEQRYNVIFEINDLSAEYTDFIEMFLTHQMAGTPIGDMVLLGGHSTIIAMQTGQLTDMGTLNFPGSDLFGDNLYIIPTFVDGDSIWQVNIRTAGNVWGTCMLGVNMDLVARLGLQDPVALYEAGQWNWDNFLSIMRTTAAQGYFGISGVLGDIAGGLLAANDGFSVTADLNYGFDQPNAMVALDFMATIMEERLWMYDRDGVVPIHDDDWWRSHTSHFENGQATFFSMYAWSHGMVGGLDAVGFNFQMIPFPVGPNNTSGNVWSAGVPQALVMPAGVEDPQFVLQVMEALMAWPGDELWLQVEGSKVGLREQLPTEGCVVRLVDVAANRTAHDSGWDVSQYRYALGSFAQDVFHGTRTMAESVEYHRGPSQELLDNMFR